MAGPLSPGKEVLEKYFNMRERKIPVDEKDCDGNKENDENGNGNRPDGNSRSAWTTADWVILH